MRKIFKIIYLVLLKIICKKCFETRETQTPVFLKHIIFQKLLGFNRRAYWPVHFSSMISNPKNILAGIDTSPGWMPGCYIQGIGKVYIGDYTQISSNVGIISANHDLHDTRKHEVSKVIIGKYCWLGMNVVVLPNVTLGDFTIVGAGSIVTKPFPDGYCVLAGNPAKIIKKLDKNKCIPFENKNKYNGYIKAEEFDKYRRKYLNV